MNKKKGFTIIELLAAVVIVGIILGLAILVINRYIIQGHETVNSQLEKNLVLSAKSYFSDNTKKLKLIGKDGAVVWYTVLKSNNYIENDLIDSKGNSCSKSYVYVKKDGSKYQYTGCIVCDNDGYNNTTGKKECTENFNNIIDCKFDPTQVTMGIKAGHNTTSLNLTCSGKGITPSKISSNMFSLDKNLGTFSITNTEESKSGNKNILKANISFKGNKDGEETLALEEGALHVTDRINDEIPNARVSSTITIDGQGPKCEFSGAFKDSSPHSTKVTSARGGDTVYYKLTCKDDNIDKNYYIKANDFSSKVTVRTSKDNQYSSDGKSITATIEVTLNNTEGDYKLSYNKDSLKDKFENGNNSISSESLSVDNTGPSCKFNGPTSDYYITKSKKFLDITDASDEFVYYSLTCTDKSGVINPINSTNFTSYIINNNFSKIVLENTQKVEGSSSGYKYIIKAYKNSTEGVKANLSFDQGKIKDGVGNNGNGTIESSYVRMIDGRKKPSCTIKVTAGENRTQILEATVSSSYDLSNYTWTNDYSDPSYYSDTTNGEKIFKTTAYSSGYYYFHVKDVNGLTGHCSTEVTIPAPATPVLVASDGKDTGKWHNADYTLSAKESDPKESDSNVIYYYGISSTTPEEVKPSDINTIEQPKITTETKSTVYYAKACDKNNTQNCSGLASYNAKLDKTKPTCTFEMIKYKGSASGSYTKIEDYKDNHWTQENVRIGNFKCSDSLSGIEKQYIKFRKNLEKVITTAQRNESDISLTKEQKDALTLQSSSSNKYVAFTPDTPKKGEGEGIHQVYLWGYDNAGNSIQYVRIVKIDATPPKLTLSIEPTTSGKKLCKSNSVTVTCKDSLSGVSAMTASDNKVKATSKEQTLKEIESGSGLKTDNMTVNFKTAGSRYLRAGCIDGAKNGTWTGDDYDTDAYYKVPKGKETDYSSSCREDDDTTCEARIKMITYTGGQAKYYWEEVESYGSTQNVISKTGLAWCNDKKGTSYSSCGTASSSNWGDYCIKASGGKNDGNKRATCSVKQCKRYYTNHKETSSTYKIPGYCKDTSNKKSTSDSYDVCESGYYKRTTCTY